MKRTLSGIGLLALTAPAAALNFVEGTDFPNGSSFVVPPAVSVGVLALGSNTVTGRLDGACIVGDCNSGVGSGDSQDSFLVTVAAGTLLTGLSLSSSNVSGPTAFRASLSLNLPGSGVLVVPTLPNNAASGNLLGGAVAAGTYSVSIFGQSASAAGPFAYPYVVSFNVSAVPEAPVAWLLGGGLLGMAAFRRASACSCRTGSR